MSLTICLIGYSNSGKETFYQAVCEVYPIPRITTGDIVRKEVRERGLSLTSQNISLVSDMIRVETNNNFMSVAEEEIKKILKQSSVLLVDCLRELTDLQTIREYSEENRTIAILSHTLRRYARMISRNREGDPSSLEDFIKLEEKERCLGVEDLILSADYKIENNGTIEEYQKRSRKLIKTILENRHS